MDISINKTKSPKLKYQSAPKAQTTTQDSTTFNVDKTKASSFTGGTKPVANHKRGPQGL